MQEERSLRLKAEADANDARLATSHQAATMKSLQEELEVTKAVAQKASAMEHQLAATKGQLQGAAHHAQVSLILHVAIISVYIDCCFQHILFPSNIIATASCHCSKYEFDFHRLPCLAKIIVHSENMNSKQAALLIYRASWS